MTSTPQPGSGWLWFFRWGPYGLLGLSWFPVAATAPALMTSGEVLLAGALTVAALCWQLGWDRSLRRLPGRATGRGGYFVVRTALAFGLCWLNPFFSIFALMGYFDAGRHLPGRRRRWGLLGVAATLASSQASVPDGPPPDDLAEVVVFMTLFALHTSLALGLERLNDREAEKRQEQEALIGELAVANARLAQTLAENATLHQQLLLQARAAGVTAERRRLVAELHDVLVQGLTGVVAQLQAAVDGADGIVPAHVERAAELARRSLGEARRSVHDLTPGPLVHRTLPEALTEIVARWSAGSGAHAEFTVVGTVEPLHAEIEAALLRITEEALTNVARHAGANRVGVTLSYIDDEVTLDVRDDGCGFDPHTAPEHSDRGGFGLDGMRLRAQRVLGVVEVESEPGAGTAISARVPSVGP